MKTHNPLLAKLRHHVTGAIERGEGVAIVEQTSTPCQHTPAYKVRFTCGWSDGSQAEAKVTILAQTDGNHRELALEVEDKLNSHAELLAALVSAMSAIPNPDDPEACVEGLSDYQKFWNREMHKTARAAIAKAKGVQP